MLLTDIAAMVALGSKDISDIKGATQVRWSLVAPLWTREKF